MSDKRLGVKWNRAREVQDVAQNSSMLLSGRGTSTPINPQKLSLSGLDMSIEGLDITRDTLSTPKMNVSAVPIFGRQNLQLMSDYRKNGDQSGAMKILQKHTLGHRVLNVDKTFNDKAQPSTSALCNTKEERKEIKRQIFGNKRRSVHNDSRGPSFKTSSKRPKSPRLLTAMRAKLRINREKIKNEDLKEAKENEKKTISKQKNIKQLHCPPKLPLSTGYSKYKLTIPQSPKLGRVKNSRQK